MKVYFIGAAILLGFLWGFRFLQLNSTFRLPSALIIIPKRTYERQQNLANISTVSSDLKVVDTDFGTPISSHDDLTLEVKKLLMNPSNKEYNLERSGPYWSQYGQEKLVDDWLQRLEHGFFIEAGGYNGEDLSNTLYLERSRGWTGLLVEANPELFKVLQSKNRKCYSINSGLSMVKNQSKKLEFTFKLAGPIGGFMGEYSEAHLARTHSEISQKAPWMEGVQGSGIEVNISTFPLHTILSEVSERQRLHSEELKKIPGDLIAVVDFFSLDTEGSEPRILEAIDFERIMFGLIVVEFNSELEIREKLVTIMEKRNFKLLKEAGIDLWFGNPAYFQYRQLTLPAQ